MTDMMTGSDAPSRATAASTPSPAVDPTTGVSVSRVPVTGGAEARPEVGGSWGLMLVPVLICVVLTLYVSLV